MLKYLHIDHFTFYDKRILLARYVLNILCDNTYQPTNQQPNQPTNQPTNLPTNNKPTNWSNNFIDVIVFSFNYLAYHGRWLYNVTYITEDMWDEVRCRKFHENETLKKWTREQLVNAFPCPCYEQRMREVSLHRF